MTRQHRSSLQNVVGHRVGFFHLENPEGPKILYLGACRFQDPSSLHNGTEPCTSSFVWPWLQYTRSKGSCSTAPCLSTCHLWVRFGAGALGLELCFAGLTVQHRAIHDHEHKPEVNPLKRWRVRSRRPLAGLQSPEAPMPTLRTPSQVLSQFKPK